MSILPPSLDLSCFATDYPSARRRFLEALESVAPDLLVEHKSIEHPLAGPDGSALFCDWALLSRSPAPAELLVLISGTHGVEGFAGSAIQCDLLPLFGELLRDRPTLGVLVIHALNPWGFAWLRRCDHEGIDINRNFVDFDAGLPNNAFYAKWHPAIKNGDTEDEALLAALHRPEITRGQYQFASGLFFGGQGPSWSRRLLEKECRHPLFAEAHRLAVIDLHTGLGPYGYGEVINDHPASSVGFALAQSWYGGNACSTELGQSISTPKQGLLDYFWHRRVGKRGCFVTLEFGTYPLRQLLLTLVAELRYDNRCRKEDTTRSPAAPEAASLRDFFYPHDASWQHMVLLRARHVASLAISGLSE